MTAESVRLYDGKGKSLQRPFKEITWDAVAAATTDKPTSNEAGIIAAGIDDNGHGYVIDDQSLRGDPVQWSYAAVACYHRFGANELVAEDNQGGKMVDITIHTIDNAPPVRLIHAMHSKRARAEPIAMLYEQGKIHHVGFFLALEDEMCSWNAQTKESPNRIDALVHVLTTLMLGTQPPPEGLLGCANPQDKSRFIKSSVAGSRWHRGEYESRP